MADTPISPSASRAAEPIAKEQDVKTSRIKAILGSLDLDRPTMLMMFKGSLPPTIAIAIYQAESVANIFQTLGYLVAIISVMSLSILPRGKFLQNLILNLIATCIGSSISLLGIWSAIQARNHTAPGSVDYNSSQSAVCAVWLFANIYFVNTLRAKVPALQFPVIMYSIFTNVSFTFGPLFPTMTAGIAVVERLLKGFLTAFAIALAVNLFVIPVSSRLVVFKEQQAYLMAIRGTIKAHTAYLQSLETENMFSGTEEDLVNDTGNVKTDDSRDNGTDSPTVVPESRPQTAETPEAKALKSSIAGLTALHGKLHGDMPFGKLEAAWGKLDAHDIEDIFKKFRAILIPLIGLSTITDIFERIAERRGWVKTNTRLYNKLERWETANSPEVMAEEKRVWNEVMKILHEPFSVISQAMDEGIVHAGIVLELFPKPNKAESGDADVEAKGDTVSPGDEAFSEYLEKKMREFYDGRGETLNAWARSKGLTAEEFDQQGKGMPNPVSEWSEAECQHRRDQQQLYLILYMEHLLYSTGIAIKEFVKYADSKVKDGTMKKNRLILPGAKRMRKWIISLGNEDLNADNSTTNTGANPTNNVFLGGHGFAKHRKDPEHLPPTNLWQKIGNRIRVIPRFIGSQESAFGLRVACATLTIGIVAFLRDTQDFFTEQRLVWAMIIVTIGMTMTSGQSIFGFLARVAGTALSMVSSMIIWYIVDQRVPGVIVMLWFFILMEMYLFLKYPRFIMVWLICIVTQVLIIGYELQVKKIGVIASTATGQPYYPTYKLAPYRLACVTGGCFVAFFWTIFPYPISDRSWMRKDLGSAMYLIASYYSVVHSSIGARVRRTDGSLTDKNSPGHKLSKMRHHIFNKILLLLPSLTQHAEWQKWEINIGGKFPRKNYEEIIVRLRNIVNYMTLVSFASQAWSEESYDDPNLPATPAKTSQWLRDFSILMEQVGPTAHQITSILSLLSASVSQGMALPPHVETMLPRPFMLSRRLEQLDRGILDAKHVEELGYSAYAVMQVSSALIIDDLERLVGEVRELVGEVDFDFEILDGDGKGKRD